MAYPSRRKFGTTSTGEQVEALTLNNGRLSCEVITFGAALRTLLVPGRDGRAVDVVLGYETLEEYQNQDAYLGAVVGRYANRIAGGKFVLNGQEYTLAVNNGPNHLHGGIVGFSHRVWRVEELTCDRVVLALESPDGEEGYPGHLWVKVTYTLEENGLSIRYQAESDRDTVCNLTNHTYFNLGGQGSGSVLEQEIALCARYYTPTDGDSIPLGTVEPVDGTPMDLRALTPIGAYIDQEFIQLVQGRGYDHNYVVEGAPGRLRPAARARCAATGIGMAVETTSPGVQFYTANFLEEGRAGKQGAVYGPRHGFCLETQFYPDSPNQPDFPTCILKAGNAFAQETRFVFLTE